MILGTNRNEAYINETLTCLEFLANDAVGKDSFEIHCILKQAIAEIKTLNLPGQSNSLPDSVDVMMALKCLFNFCLIEDENNKREIIEYIQGVNKSSLRRIA